MPIRAYIDPRFCVVRDDGTVRQCFIIQHGMQAAIIKKDGPVHGVAVPSLRIEVDNEAIDILMCEKMAAAAYFEYIVPI